MMSHHTQLVTANNRLIDDWLCCQQVQWMYETDGGYESYPPEINVMIEKAHRDKKQTVQWVEEDDKQFEVDFVRMVEEKVGRAGIVLRVKRSSTGVYLSYSSQLRD